MELSKLLVRNQTLKAVTMTNISTTTIETVESAIAPVVAIEKPQEILTDWKPFTRFPRAYQLNAALSDIPEEIALTPLQGKQPKRDNWQNETPLTPRQIADLIWKGEEAVSKSTGKTYRKYYSGYGIRTGDISGGIIAIDVDGVSAQPLLDAISGGDIPKTLSWKSGKPGRYQLAFQIPDQYREVLKGFNRAVVTEWQGLKTLHDENGKPQELLELRYNGCQSCLPPSWHPTTGQYDWVHPPTTTAVEIAPQWLCDLLIEKATAEKEQKQQREQKAVDYAKLKKEQKGIHGIATDLVDFLNYDVLSRLTVEQIYNGDHNFRQYGEVLKGAPTWRASSSGTSLHVWHDGERWAFQDKATGEGGGAIQYRHKMKGGSGTPKGKEFVAIVEELAREAGLEMPKFAPKPNAFYSDDSNETGAGEKTETESEPNETYEQRVEREQARLRGRDYPSHAKIIEVEGRMTQEIIDSLPEVGWIILEGCPGAGKSWSILQNKLRFPERDYLSLSPTRALSVIIAELLGQTHREDLFVPGASHGGMMAGTKNVSACVASLHHLINELGAPRKDNFNLTLILDEVVQNLNFTYQSDICNKKGKRPLIIKALMSLVNNVIAQRVCVITSDAFMSNVELKFFGSIFPKDFPVTVVRFGWKTKPQDITFIRDYHQLGDNDDLIMHDEKVEALVDNLRVDEDDRFQIPLAKQGKGLLKKNAEIKFDALLIEASKKPMIMPVDTKSDAIAMTKKFRDMGKRVMCVCSDTSGEAEVQKFVENTTLYLVENPVDVLIYTSTLGSGANLCVSEESVTSCKQLKHYKECLAAATTPEDVALYTNLVSTHQENFDFFMREWESGTPYFKCRFGINKHLSSEDFQQQCGRDRYFTPLTIFQGNHSIAIKNCKSSLPSEHLKTFINQTEDMVFVTNLAKEIVGDRANNADLIQAMQKIVRDLEEGLNPHATLACEQRAKYVHNMKHRFSTLHDSLVAQGHNVVVDYVKEKYKDDLGEAFKEAIKDAKKDQRWEDSKLVVAQKVVSKEDATKIERKAFKIKEDEAILARYYFELEFPNLLDSMPNDHAKFLVYHEFVTEDRRRVLNGIKLWWQWNHREETYKADAKKLVFTLGNFVKTGIETPQDLMKMNSAMFKLVEKIGLFDVLKVETKDIKGYSYKDLKPVFDNIRKIQRCQKKIRDYFGVEVPKKQEEEAKCFSFFNRILDKFKMHLHHDKELSAEKNVRLYVFGVANMPQKIGELYSRLGNIRQKIEASLDGKLEAKNKSRTEDQEWQNVNFEIFTPKPETAKPEPTTVTTYAPFDDSDTDISWWTEGSMTVLAERIEEIQVQEQAPAAVIETPIAQESTPVQAPEVTPEITPELPKVAPEVSTWKNSLINAQRTGGKFPAQTWEELTSTFDEAFVTQVLDAITLVSPADAAYYKARNFNEVIAPIPAEVAATSAASRNISSLKNLLRNSINAGFETALKAWKSLHDTELPETVKAVMAALAEADQGDYKYYLNLQVSAG